jgi:DNA-binding beta-propeller fold protein YncE
MIRAIRNLSIGLLVLSASQVQAEKLVLVAGGSVEQEGVPAVQAKLRGPFGVDFNRSGEMFLVELAGGRVLKVDTAGRLTRLAGTGEKGDQGDGGPGLQAVFNGMHSLVVAPDGALLLADTWNNRVRRLDPATGRVTALAGTGEKGDAGDGPATQAKFGGIYCISLDPAGKRLYLTDLDNRRIRMLDLASGLVSTVAGNGEKGVPPDGAEAAKAPLFDPRAAAADRKGNVYVLERGGHALRVVDPAGRIRTVVGTGKKGAEGDGGAAIKATLNGPKHLCIDLDDNVIIADAENHLIRKYLPKEGKIVRVAGSGKRGTAGLGGPPLEAQLSQPHGVYVSPAGVLYIVDSSNDRVLRIEK